MSYVQVAILSSKLLRDVEHQVLANWLSGYFSLHGFQAKYRCHIGGAQVLCTELQLTANDFLSAQLSITSAGRQGLTCRHGHCVLIICFLRSEISVEEDELAGPVEFLFKLKLRRGAAKSTAPSILGSVSGIPFACHSPSDTFG